MTNKIEAGQYGVTDDDRRRYIETFSDGIESFFNSALYRSSGEKKKKCPIRIITIHFTGTSGRECVVRMYTGALRGNSVAIL